MSLSCHEQVRQRPSPVATRRRDRSLRRFAFLAAALAFATLAPTACTVRSDRPIVGPDSTLVYPSKLRNDVNASITFGLRDSRARDEEKQRDKDRQRAISRLKRDREKLLDLQQAQDREQARQAKLAAEKARKAAEKAKAKKSGKGKKAKKSKQRSTTVETAKTGETDSSKAATDDRTVKRASGDAPAASRPKADLFALSPAAIRDSLAAIDARLQQLAVEDSVAQLDRWKVRKAQGLYEDERVFDLEEDARVLATVRLENVYARGKRPITFHFVWLNAEQKRVFKKVYEYAPNDSTQALTGSFSIPPSRRRPGFYTLQVFLFRELIAQKPFELRGTGVEVPEGGGGEGM